MAKIHIFNMNIPIIQHYIFKASLVSQRLKHLPAMQEPWVWSLGREDPLEKEMETHSSILAWKISWMEPGTVRGVAKSRTRLSDFTSFLHVLFVFDSVCFILFLMQHLQMWFKTALPAPLFKLTVSRTLSAHSWEAAREGSWVPLPAGSSTLRVCPLWFALCPTTHNCLLDTTAKGQLSVISMLAWLFLLILTHFTHLSAWSYNWA